MRSLILVVPYVVGHEPEVNVPADETGNERKGQQQFQPVAHDEDAEEKAESHRVIGHAHQQALLVVMSEAVAILAGPLRVGDCCANADGSSCILVASEEKAKAFCKKPIWIKGIGAASASVNMSGRDIFTGLSAAREAADQAYKMAGVSPDDIDVAEVHDCFTIAELMAYENLGFAEPGKGCELIRNKETYKEGRIPINVDGGLLSKGHPIGATGGSQIRTIVLQLRDEAGDIQVRDPQIGLVHNIGGVGLYGNVTILGRE